MDLHMRIHMILVTATYATTRVVSVVEVGPRSAVSDGDHGGVICEDLETRQNMYETRYHFSSITQRTLGTHGESGRRESEP